MAFINIWAHVIWGTKSRQPTLIKPARYDIFKHIRENARSKGIHVDFINGYVEHVHCLISLGANQDIATIVQALKGESAFWVNNKSKVLPHRLEWCEGYYAISVDASNLDVVREYIKNQEAHHRNTTFADECEEFMRIYGFDHILE